MKGRGLLSLGPGTYHPSVVATLVLVAVAEGKNPRQTDGLLKTVNSIPLWPSLPEMASPAPGSYAHPLSVNCQPSSLPSPSILYRATSSRGPSGMPVAHTAPSLIETTIARKIWTPSRQQAEDEQVFPTASLLTHALRESPALNPLLPLSLCHAGCVSVLTPS